MAEKGLDPGLRAALEVLAGILQDEIEETDVDEPSEATLVVRGTSGIGYKMRLTLEIFTPGSGEVERA